MHDVLPISSGAVLFQQTRNGLAGGFDVDGLEVALGVSIFITNQYLPLPLPLPLPLS
jgi:hypothetical protein